MSSDSYTFTILKCLSKYPCVILRLFEYLVVLCNRGTHHFKSSAKSNFINLLIFLHMYVKFYILKHTNTYKHWKSWLGCLKRKIGHKYLHILSWDSPKYLPPSSVSNIIMMSCKIIFIIIIRMSVQDIWMCASTCVRTIIW